MLARLLSLSACLRISLAAFVLFWSQASFSVESSQASAVTKIQSNSIIYDFQPLIASLVALFSVLVTWTIAKINHKHELRKIALEKDEVKSIAAKKKRSLYSVLLSDLEMLKDSVEEDVSIFSDLCDQIADESARSEIDEAFIARAISISRPRIGGAIISEWNKIDEFGEYELGKYISRVDSYLKLLDEAMLWSRAALNDVRADPAEGDLDDLKEYVGTRYSQLLASIEQLREPLRAAAH
jgi:hypothetical protein